MKKYIPHFIIAGLLLTIAILFTTWNAQQAKQRRLISDSTLQIERLNTQLAIDSTVISGKDSIYHKLIAVARESEKDRKRLKRENSQILTALEAERARVQELNDSEAVGWFLDSNGAEHYPVVKYDSGYIIPLDVIQSANMTAVDALGLAQLNVNLKEQITGLEGELSGCSEALKNRNEVIDVMQHSDGIKDKQIAEALAQVQAADKIARKEKGKRIFWQGLTGVAAILGFVF